jgi:oligopeptide transport system substrate-binding protein
VPGTRFALDGGKLREPLARRGIVLSGAIAPITEHLYFNMADPVIGGDAPERVALRRAIAMSLDDDAYIAQFHSGIGFLQPHPVPPGIDGHDATYRNPNAYDLNSANALLDRFGYRRAADGLRTRPDGSPLALTMLRLPDSSGRDQAEFMQRALRRIGVAVAFETLAPSAWAQRLTVCRHQMVISQWVLDFPDGSSALAQFHGRNVGTQNMACFANAQFDELYDRLLVTPFGAERAALYRRLVAVLDAQMPARTMPDFPTSVLASSRVRGLVVHPVYRIVYPYVDLAASKP